MKIDRRQAIGTLAVATAGAWIAPRFALAGEPAGEPAFTLPALPYDYAALEPHIDAETMRIHHGKHHAAYVAKLNEAVAATPGLAGRRLEELLAGLEAVPETARTAVRNHGGGHHNHSLFWTSMKPGGAPPSADLRASIDATFGSLDGLSGKLIAAATGVFGSGWAWLAAGAAGRLELITTANQDSPLTSGLTPLLGVDVWEHAYYLKYQNRRAEYLAAWWNVVDWQAVERRLAAARG
ncbi:MAG: superoxide dismutase [Thermoanaerobaculia bacterium]|nr:MAG: superoxide dismutase [Thermoanaerobaculia bacterium]MBZ0101891.1 superoxide dismutase [Thermoanaerobaculia bacterium]